LYSTENYLSILKQTMQSSLAESVQQSVRPGKCVDAYYPDPETAQKSCWRTSQNTRYVQQFANLTGGSSVFTIPPNNGIQDIVCIFELPKYAPGAATGLGLNRSWAYALIKQVSFRYGGSSQFFLSGQQLLQNALRKASNNGTRDDLFALGGNACDNTSLEAEAQKGYVWLSLPHCTPTADGKLPPLPSDLLTQQIQITVELFPIASIFSISPDNLAPGVPATTLNFAEFQVQQVLLENQGDALARRVDMTSNALSYPIEFTQQELTIPLPQGQLSHNLTLTGFRAGECKNIQIWVSRDEDLTDAVKNPFRWYDFENIVMLYAGEVYFRADKGVSKLWNLVNSRITPAVQDVELTSDAITGQIITTTPALDIWAELPFGQTYDTTTAHTMYMAGKNITNGIVNLNIDVPAVFNDAGSHYRLHVSYNYNAVLMFSQGTADYIL
jgi:hypothetical protein